jgi:hypothetical protein
MLGKLKAMAVAALVGAGGGGCLGLVAWLMERLGGDTGIAELAGAALQGATIGSVAGLLFALGLIGYGHIRKGPGLSKHGAMAIGWLVGPVSFFGIAWATGTSPWSLDAGTVLGVVAVYGTLGAIAGRVLAHLAARGDETFDETPPEAIEASDPLADFRASQERRSRSREAH